MTKYLDLSSNIIFFSLSLSFLSWYNLQILINPFANQLRRCSKIFHQGKFPSLPRKRNGRKPSPLPLPSLPHLQGPQEQLSQRVGTLNWSQQQQTYNNSKRIWCKYQIWCNSRWFSCTMHTHEKHCVNPFPDFGVFGYMENMSAMKMLKILYFSSMTSGKIERKRRV